MRRALWTNVLLLAAVAALALFVYLKPESGAPVEYALSTLKPETAVSIRIEREGAAPVVLERRQGAWLLSAPFRARAGEFMVERLLEILTAKSARRWTAADLARFDLERPEARLTIDGQAFDYGVVNAVTREQYVLTAGAVYVVHPRYGAALPGTAAELVSRQPLGPGEQPVRIQLPDFTVERRDGKWTLAPAAEDLSQDDLVRWVDEWRLASALRVEPYAGGRAQGEIKLQLKNGSGLTLGILNRRPELVLVRPDEQLQYYFGAGSAQRLLSPPGTGVRSEATVKK